LLEGIREYLFPVGRLDYDSEGLLILTNDGELAAQLTHPRHQVSRVYEVRVLGVPDMHDINRLAKGITIDGRKTIPASVRLLGNVRRGITARAHSDYATLSITVREGRNRQIRKMCDAIGHPVAQLKRVGVGPIRDSRLKPGQWRELQAHEIESLKKAARQP